MSVAFPIRKWRCVWFYFRRRVLPFISLQADPSGRSSRRFPHSYHSISGPLSACKCPRFNLLLSTRPAIYFKIPSTLLFLASTTHTHTLSLCLSLSISVDTKFQHRLLRTVRKQRVEWAELPVAFAGALLRERHTVQPACDPR
jgi:hypothetical protein